MTKNKGMLILIIICIILLLLAGALYILNKEYMEQDRFLLGSVVINTMFDVVYYFALATVLMTGNGIDDRISVKTYKQFIDKYQVPIFIALFGAFFSNLARMNII